MALKRELAKNGACVPCAPGSSASVNKSLEEEEEPQTK